jgi:hypothetical protein
VVRVPSPYRDPEALRRRGGAGFAELTAPTRKAPPCPVAEWPAEVKTWWDAVWRHPVSGAWSVVADAQAVRRLGDLYAAVERAEVMTPAALAQIVKLETELLLTPAARHRQHVRLPLEGAPPAPAPQRSRRPSARDRLTVVEPGDHAPI